MELFDKNMAAFSARNAHGAKQVAEAQLASSTVVSAKCGLPTLKVKKDDSEIFVHSSYDPSREAQRWVEGQTIEPKDIIVVFGFGLGYHVLELFGRSSEDVRIIVVEPQVEFIKQAFCHVDLTDLLASQRVLFVVSTEYALLQKAIGHFLDIYRLDKIKPLYFHPLLKNFEQEYYPYQKVLYDEVLFQYINTNTILHFSLQWTKNFFINLREAVLATGVETLFGLIKDKPAIIVSSGPSLNKNVHLLKRAKNRAFILSMGSALGILLKHGIEPDLVISIDGGEPNLRHFQDLPDNLVPLLFDPMINAGILKEVKGPKFVGFSNNILNIWMKQFGFEKGCLSVGPSVANTGLDLLRRMGANPVIFVGQDLAYTDGVLHASGTAHRTKKTLDDVVKEKKLLEVDGYFGGKVYTDQSLYTFLKWFKEYIPNRPELSCINATEGGAKIPGTIQMPFQEALEQYCTEEADFSQFLTRIHQKNKVVSDDEIVRVTDQLKEVAEELVVLQEKAKQGLAEAKKLEKMYKNELPAQRDVDIIIKRLNKIDQIILQNRKASIITIFVVQPILRSLKLTMTKAKPDETEKDKGQRISQESIMLYSGIKQVAEQVRGFIEEGLSVFEEAYSIQKGGH